MNAPFRPLPRTVDQRRVQVEQVEGSTGGLMRVTLFIDIEEPGEALAQLNFPVLFVEKPAYFHGAELALGQNPFAGSLPTYSAIVRDWSYKIDDPTGKRYFSGATVMVVTTGDAGLHMILHFHAEGKALR